MGAPTDVREQTTMLLTRMDALIADFKRFHEHLGELFSAMAEMHEDHAEAIAEGDMERAERDQKRLSMISRDAAALLGVGKRDPAVVVFPRSRRHRGVRRVTGS